MAKTETVSFAMYEEIGIGLPNLYQCAQCKRLINCMHPPTDKVCSWCQGKPNDYEKLAQRQMVIIDCKYSEEQGLLGFLFNTGAILLWGPGVVPGTDVPTYGFMHSRGFSGRDEYKQAQAVAQAYSRGLGFSGCQEHWESYHGVVG